MIGLYEDDMLIKEYKSEQKSSEILPIFLNEILKNYSLKALFYANGPGSYMGIKLSFLSLKTLSIVLNIPLFAISAFELNGYGAISANKGLCFVYENSKISLKKTDSKEFFLPKNLSSLKVEKDNLPFYFLDAV